MKQLLAGDYFVLKLLLIFALFAGVIVACSNVVEEANVGQCLQHKYENGTFKVKKKSEEELVLEELRPEGPGPIKIVNRFYGGWIVVTCPEKDQWPK